MNGIIIGAGYVGSACIADWPDQNDTLIATTTRKKNISKLQRLTPHVEIINEENKNKLVDLLEYSDFAIVCVAPKDPSKYLETYLETAKITTKVLSKRTTPFYLLYTSSTSVYGNHNGNDVNESSECLADSANAQILIETEQCYLQAENEAIDVCILRLGGIYGPGREVSSWAQRFAGQTLIGRDSPTNLSPLSVITNGIAWCVKKRLTGMYNLVENTHPTKDKLYGDIIRKLDLLQPNWTQPHICGARISNQKILNSGFEMKQR